VHEADFDEEGEAAFPFGGGAGDVVNLAAPGALQEAHEGAEEAAFAAGKAGPPLLDFKISGLHARNDKTGRGTFLGLYPKIF
jgi:hypothetical protein